MVDSLRYRLIEFVTDVLRWCPHPKHERGLITPNDFGKRSTAWRLARGLSADPARIGFKLTEEVGELARALIAEWEGRPGRGDPGQEAAQVIIVLASLMNVTHPGWDLFQAVETELKRIGA